MGETLEAASDGRVETLLFEAGVERAAFVCPECGRASVDGGSCPLDGVHMEPEPHGLDLAVHQTLRHGGSVWRSSTTTTCSRSKASAPSCATRAEALYAAFRSDSAGAGSSTIDSAPG